DAHDDHREHQQAQVAVGHLRRGRHQGEHQDHDQRHDRKAAPHFLSHWRAAVCSFATTNLSSFAMSSSLTWTICFSLSTSTSSTSSMREGQAPCFRQMMQLMISTMPCTRISAPAIGMTVLNG